MLSLSQKYECRLYHKQALQLPERVGEIPLFSLHKIKSATRKGITPLGKDTLSLFLRILISQNIKYKNELKRDWNCVTADHIVKTIDLLDNELKKAINGLIPKEKSSLTGPDKEILVSLIASKNIIKRTLKEWFDKNFDFLLYDTSSSIPWAIVQELRTRLNIWVFKNTNLFGDEIEEVIFNVAQKQGVKTDGISAEDAWKAMGGRLFTE